MFRQAAGRYIFLFYLSTWTHAIELLNTNVPKPWDWAAASCLIGSLIMSLIGDRGNGDRLVLCFSAQFNCLILIVYCQIN